MKDKKLQVFVSSTYTDLKEERQAAVEAILSSGNIPAGMELFSAGDETQMTVIKRWIDESDVYLLILGGRYGSVDKATGKSYTQLEYEYAIEQKKPLFAVVITDKALNEKTKHDGIAAIERENPQLLNEFKSIVLTNLVKFWDDKKDIKIAIHETLSELGYRQDLTGWIRGDNNVNTSLLAEEIARLTKENADLRSRLNNSDNKPTPLYAGLTYQELEGLLKREKDDSDNIYANLFDYFLANGEGLSRGMLLSYDSFYTQKLTSFKLIYAKFNGPNYIYLLTEDGHNFYLKALLSSSKP